MLGLSARAFLKEIVLMVVLSAVYAVYASKIAL